MARRPMGKSSIKKTKAARSTLRKYCVDNGNHNRAILFIAIQAMLFCSIAYLHFLAITIRQIAFTEDADINKAFMLVDFHGLGNVTSFLGIIFAIFITLILGIENRAFKLADELQKSLHGQTSSQLTLEDFNQFKDESINYSFYPALLGRLYLLASLVTTTYIANRFAIFLIDFEDLGGIIAEILVVNLLLYVLFVLIQRLNDVSLKIDKINTVFSQYKYLAKIEIIKESVFSESNLVAIKYDDLIKRLTKFKGESKKFITKTKVLQSFAYPSLSIIVIALGWVFVSTQLLNPGRVQGRLSIENPILLSVTVVYLLLLFYIAVSMLFTSYFLWKNYRVVGVFNFRVLRLSAFISIIPLLILCFRAKGVFGLTSTICLLLILFGILTGVFLGVRAMFSENTRGNIDSSIGSSLSFEVNSSGWPMQLGEERLKRIRNLFHHANIFNAYQFKVILLCAIGRPNVINQVDERGSDTEI
ncbi:hypothetical protein [Corynebacterium amycolatum]|uniref:hypothetical protein n=1 Tax=Corynebacterium amycolatum TaxID=43765 RepID=UPI003165AB7A